MVITKAQRQALKRIYDRVPLYDLKTLERVVRYKSDHHLMTGHMISDAISLHHLDAARLTYRQFRKRVQYSYGCVLVEWCGMWLGIEKDGYTHS